MNEARTKAHSKDYAAAISLYDALLKVNPDNLEAKIGKARVLSWTGKYEEAQELYEAVLSRDPENIEASIGLADLNAWQKRYGKATEILESLLSVDRENREVLLRLARFHLWAGEKRRSIRYCDEILEKFPDDPDAKAIRNQAREIHAFEYYAGYQFLKITDNPDGHNLYAGIRYLPKTKISLYSQLDYLDRYGETDMRGLLGGSWQIHNKWTLSSEMGVPSDAGSIRAFQDGLN